MKPREKNRAVEILKDLIVEAIADKEDFHLTEDDAHRRSLRYPSKSQKNNNPGNLKVWGSYSVLNGTVKFPSVAEGFKALSNLVEINIGRGLTFLEFFYGKEDTYDGFCKDKDIDVATSYATFIADRVRSGLQFKSVLQVTTVMKDVTQGAQNVSTD